MAITINIAGVDKSSVIDWQSVRKQEVLSREPDTLDFLIKNFGTKTYQPTLSDEVIMYDGATKIFGGVIVEMQEGVQGLAKYLSVKCKDYSHLLDKQLIAKTYEGFTGDDIVADFITTFTDPADGITGTAVACTEVVEKIVFNYISVTDALTKLANMLGDYEWYIDYDKDIHFLQKGSVLAPFSLTDTSQNFLFGTLDITTNNHQIRNHIILRGGLTEGDSITDVKISDGAQRTFFIGYDFDTTTLTLEKALAASPTVWTSLTFGADGKDNPASFDCLYNPNSGLVIFPEATKPAVNDRIRWVGTPIFPLIVEMYDYGSIGIYGEYEYIIIDKTIRSRDSAQQRINAELMKYAYPEHIGGFSTLTSGLKAGQIITINSTIRNIAKDFLIDRVATRLNDNSGNLRFDVSIKAQENVGIIDVMKKLLVTGPADLIDISQNEVVDRLYSSSETITLVEVCTPSTSHNMTPETITLTPTLTEQPLDYATIFVAGPWTPTIAVGGADTKRVFCADGGYVV